MNKIAEIINGWNPIGLFPMAPKDEYINEIKKIYDILCSNETPQVQSLAYAINKIFTDAFGKDIYNEDMEQCMQIAIKILSSVK